MFNEQEVENCGKQQGKAISCQPSTKLKNNWLKELLKLVQSDVWCPAPTTS